MKYISTKLKNDLSINVRIWIDGAFLLRIQVWNTFLPNKKKNQACLFKRKELMQVFFNTSSCERHFQRCLRGVEAIPSQFRRNSYINALRSLMRSDEAVESCRLLEFASPCVNRAWRSKPREMQSSDVSEVRHDICASWKHVSTLRALQRQRSLKRWDSQGMGTHLPPDLEECCPRQWWK